MKKAVFSIGLNDQHTGRQIVPTFVAEKALRNLALRNLGGFTLIHTIGGYIHEDGRRVTERGFQITVYETRFDHCIAFARRVCDALNQESVAIEREEDGKHETEFVGGTGVKENVWKLALGLAA